MLAPLMLFACGEQPPVNNPPQVIVQEPLHDRYFDNYIVETLKEPNDSALFLDNVFDLNNNAWFTAEFNAAIGFAADSDDSITMIELPDDGPIFGNPLGGGGSSRIPALVENIITSPDGRVWFSQGGSGLSNDPDIKNHSRIISIEPNTQEIEVYRLPGNRNGVHGLHWDETRNGMWFTEYGVYNGEPKLGFFNPSEVDTSLQFGEIDPAPYKYVDIPDDIAWASHLEMDPYGNIYIMGSFSNTLHKYNIDSNTFTKYDLPKAKFQFHPIIHAFPWYMQWNPVNNTLVYTDYFDDEIVFFDPITDTFKEIDVIAPESEYPRGSNRTHTLDIDKDGNVLFTNGDFLGVYCLNGEMDFLKLGYAIGRDGESSGGLTGISINDGNGTIIVNGFFENEVYRLRLK